MKILAAKKMGFIALTLCSLSGQLPYAGIPVIDGGSLSAAGQGDSNMDNEIAEFVNRDCGSAS